jgi:hypothetical protein
MTIDERVRDALHAYADPIEPTPGSWDRIEARLDDRLPRERQARGPLVLAAVGILVIVALIGFAVVRDGEHTDVVIEKSGPTSVVPAAPKPPQRVLVFGTTSAGGTSMVVLPSASRDGSGDMQGVSGVVAGSPVAVTPDGSFAYVVRKSPNMFSTCGGGASIFRQVIGSGARAGDEIANATAPAVSPDGRYLAHLECKNASDGPSLVLRDLRTGTAESALVIGVDYFAGVLQFSADSARLLVANGPDASGPSGGFEFDVVDGRLEARRTIATTPQTFVAGYWGPGAYLAVGIGPEGQAVVVAPSTRGGVERALFDARGLEGSITGLIPNVAGTAMLVIVDDARLFWWAPGMEQPAKLDDEMTTAAWMPDAQSPTGPNAAALPTGIAAVRRNELVVLGATDGNQHSSLGTVDPGTTLAPSDDGRVWVVGNAAPPEVCDRSGATTRPALQRLDTPTGRRDDWIGGAYNPAASKDDVVAYGYACDGRGLGLSSLRTEKNYRVDPRPERLGASHVEAVYPFGWSPDGRTLLYVADLGTRVRLLTARLAPGFFAGGARSKDVDIREIPGPRLNAATLSGNDTVVGVLPSAPTVLVERRIGDHPGAPNRLTELPEPVTSVVADRSGSNFLVVTSTGELWRWSRGQTGPAPVADGVTAAVWLPWS